MKSEKLLLDRHLRDKCAGRYDVLEKIKQLLLIPETDLATTQQVADYYEVTVDVIKMTQNKFREELLGDGLLVLSGKETKAMLASKKNLPANFRGYFTYDNIRFNNKINILFPRRAVLRIGMLLRDSEIAKDILSLFLGKLLMYQQMKKFDGTKWKLKWLF